MKEQKIPITKILYKDVEVAEMLGISQQMVHKLVRNGALAEPCRISSKAIRWHVDDINQYIDTIYKNSRLTGEPT
jgi:predicted DNA-binding transcriptional regulator AlpA